MHADMTPCTACGLLTATTVRHGAAAQKPFCSECRSYAYRLMQERVERRRRKYFEENPPQDEPLTELGEPRRQRL